VANGTAKMTVGEPGWNSTQVHRKLPSQYHLPHTYTSPPDDGLVMPETCRGILI
jgi:hypothetical protein